MSELDDIRAEIQRLEQSAKRKIDRNRREKGVSIAGTMYDPRRDKSKTKFYNKNNLNAYRHELNEFVSRKTQFVQGRNGILSEAAFRAYKKPEEQVRELHEAHELVMLDIVPPILSNGTLVPGMPIFMHRAMVYRYGDARDDRHSPYSTFNRVPGQIEDAEALEALTKRQQEQLEPGYMAKRITQEKEKIIKALMVNNDLEMMEGISELTEAQFRVLWWGATDFAQAIFDKYKRLMATLEGEDSDKENYQHQLELEDDSDDTRLARGMVGWAKTLPKTDDFSKGGNTLPKRKTRRSKK